VIQAKRDDAKVN